MELWGILLTPIFHENINLCISLTKSKSIHFSSVLKILERSYLKQNKFELNILISYGDMGVCGELLGVAARFIKFQ